MVHSCGGTSQPVSSRPSHTISEVQGPLPYDSADSGDVVDGVAKHDKVHGLLALAVKLCQVFFHGGLQALEVLHLLVHLQGGECTEMDRPVATTARFCREASSQKHVQRVMPWV